MALVDLITSFHFYVMLLSGIFFSVSITAVAFHKPKRWLLLHQSFASLGLVTGIIGLILLGGLELAIIHGLIGLLTLISFVVIISIGLYAIKQKDKNARTIHLWLSRIIYILSLLIIVLGIITLVAL
ncbi:MAG: hypothetical protein ACXABG_03555 [Promethearchaeota archaeon]|jgi:hypothetical protein